MAAMAAVFPPTLGPLLDHYYAERLPNHTHLYLGPGDPGHVHPFEVQGHSHYHPFDAPTDGIVYLASYDGSSPVMVDGTVYAIQQSPPFVGPDDDAAAYGITPDSSFPKTRYLLYRKTSPRLAPFPQWR